ncbi:MAG: class I SAM-dependent methyltransferase [Vicinamibacterales bacterium]
MTALPFGSASVTLVTAGYGLRNVPDLDAAIAEIARVLADGGRFLSLDFNRPEWAPLRWCYLAYLDCVGGALGWLLRRPGCLPLHSRVDSAVSSAAGVADRLRARGFSSVRIIPTPRRAHDAPRGAPIAQDYRAWHMRPMN